MSRNGRKDKDCGDDEECVYDRRALNAGVQSPKGKVQSCSGKMC